MIKFSVIIITYNRAKILSRALQSLLTQTEKDWEAWIIDDGSTDHTEEIVQPFIKANTRIHYFKQENKGEAGARNQGITLAKGEFITFLDSDDEFTENHLASRKQLLDSHSDIQLLHGGTKIIGNEYVPDRHDYTKKIHLSECVIGATFVMRPKDFLQLGGYKPMPIGTDADLFERAEKQGFKILKTDIPSYIYYRNSPDSMTTQLLGKN